MTTAPTRTASRPVSAVQVTAYRRILVAGLFAGSCDAVFAVLHVWIMKGQFMPVRIFQGVASGALGKASLNGGVKTALIGLVFHFLIATIWAAVFFLAVRHMSWIRDVVRSPNGPIKLALIYGPLIWIFMYFVIIRPRPVSISLPAVRRSTESSMFIPVKGSRIAQLQTYSETLRCDSCSLPTQPRTRKLVSHPVPS